MKIPIPATVLLVAVATLVLGFVGLWSLVAPADQADDSPVIAWVDGSPVTAAQAASRLAGVSEVHEAAEMDGEWRALVLESLVDDVLVAREASRQGIAPTADDQREAFEELQAMFPDPDAFHLFLTERELDEGELRRRVTLQLTGARVYEAITAEVTATPEQVEAYYEEHRTEFATHDGERPLLEVRDDIESLVTKTAKDAAFAEWLAAQREAVDVEVVSDEWR
jgi:hypothetical protein